MNALTASDHAGTHLKVLAALLLVSALSVGFPQEASADDAVIQLGDETVTEAEFNDRFALAARSIAARQGIPYNEQTRALFESLRPRYLEQLATERVLLAEAEARGVTIPDEEVDAQLEQIRGGYETEEAFTKFLNEVGFENEADFRDFIRENLLVQRVVEELSQGVEVTDEEVRSFYDENQAQINAPFERVRDRIQQQLVGERLNEQIAELREASDVQVFPENLTQAATGQAGQGTTGGAVTGGAMTGGSDAGTDTSGAVSPEEFASLQTATYEIYPSEGFDVNGTVQVAENVDGGARVTVTLQNTEDGQMYPSHFHEGDCGSGGEIVYPLEPLPGGPESIVTEVDASVFDIINSDLYINIHRSPDDLGTIVACGEVGLGANDQWR